MGIKSKAISDTVYEQAQASLKKVGRSSKAGHRLQAIISAKRHGITAVAKIYDITRATLMSWIRRFEKESTEGLRIKPGRGPKPKMGPEIEEEVRAIIKASPRITIDQLRLKVMEKHGIKVGRSTIHRLMKKLSFSYITPRPRHYKSDKDQQEEFKKKSTQPH
jgi:transposase